MGIIHILDERIAAQIAAGEVIERPVSVVKELLENALDAGADRIDIDIMDGGLGLIRMSDNGCGMAQADLPLAFARHATSKIASFNDLFALSSYGFRGEALASVAAISQVTAVSGTNPKENAWSYEVQGGGEGSLKMAPPLQGTILEIRNLFYNVPARRKFMKSNTQEAGRIRHLVSMYALARPDVTFNLTVQRDAVFQTTNRNTTEARLEMVFGDILKGHILHLPRTELHPNHFVEAWLSDASVTRANRQDEVTFVNDRYVDSKELRQIIERAYYSFIPADRFPIVLLKLSLPPEAVDVNVHPAKTKVQMVHPERWRDSLVDLLKDTLWHSAVALKLKGTAFADVIQEEDVLPGILPVEAPSASAPHNDDVSPKETATTDTPAPDQTSFLQQEDLMPRNRRLFSAEPAQPYVTEGAAISANLPGDAGVPVPPAVAHTTLLPGDIVDLEPIGQLHHTFILAQNEDGLYIIDQHTCHERILYERYRKALDEGDIVLQTFLIPQEIHLTPLQDSLLLSHIITFRDLGLKFEQVQPGRVFLLSVPVFLAHLTDYQGLVEDILDRFQSANEASPSQLMEAVLTGAACKGAVKAKQALNREEIKALLNELSQAENAHTCPHGRPTVFSLTMTDLYRYFKRGSFGGSRWVH